MLVARKEEGERSGTAADVHGIVFFLYDTRLAEKGLRLAVRPLGWYERLNVIKCGPIGRASRV